MTVVRKLTTVWGFKTDNAKVIAFAKSVDRAKRNVDGVSRALGKVGDQVKRAGKVLLGFGAAVTAGVVIPALKVEDSLKNTMTMVTATGAEFDRLEVGMRKFGFAMSNELGMSAAKVNEGFYQVLSTGAEALSKDFTELATTAMKMGKVVGLEPAVAVEKLADSVNAFSLPMTKARDVADKFFKTTQLAATNLPQLTMAMRDAGPTAAGLNVSLDETLSILGAFAAGGIKGAEAGTAFKMVLSRLSAPTSDAKMWMDRLGVSTFDLNTKAMRPMIDVLTDYVAALEPLNDEQKAAAVSAIAGKLAMSKFLGMMNRDMGVLKRWNKELENSEGALERAFVIKMSSGLQQLAKLKHEVINTAAKIGMDLIPTIKEAGEKFRDWMKDNQRAITEYGKAFTTSIKDSIGWVEKHREGLVKTAKILAAMWITTKLVSFGIALKGLVVAFAAFGSFLLSPAAPMIILAATTAIALDLLQTYLDKQAKLMNKEKLAEVDKEIADRRRADRIRRLEGTLSQARQAATQATKEEAAARKAREKGNKAEEKYFKAAALGSRKEVNERMRQANKLRKLLGETSSSALPAWATALEKSKTGGKPGSAGGAGGGGGGAGGGAAGGGKSILDDIFQPGFGEGVAANFRDFLMQRFQGGQPTLAGQERPLDLRSLSSLMSKQSGDQSTKNERNVYYYIQGSQQDSKKIADEIEQRERRWAMDFAMLPISAVKIPGGG